MTNLLKSLDLKSPWQIHSIHHLFHLPNNLLNALTATPAEKKQIKREFSKRNPMVSMGT